MRYNVTIDRLPGFALFDLQGPASIMAGWCADLPELTARPNWRTGTDGIDLCHVGPGRWLLRAPLSEEASWNSALRPTEAPPEISIVRVSDTLTFFRVTGPDAPQVMSIACPLDVHEGVFEPHAVSHTEFFGQRALVLRCEGGFDCAVDKSYGEMISACLRLASGVAPD